MGLVGFNIIDANDWFQKYPPKKGAAQWACKHSALAFAEFILASAPDLPNAIKESLSFAGSNENGDYQWSAEYETKLPEKGEGRNHDFIIYNDEIFVGIEAKADEPFDVKVGEWLEKPSSDGGKNRQKRINKLSKLIYGTEKPDEEIRYQLISATAGVLREAKNRHLKKCMLLVVGFKSDISKEKKLSQNSSDFLYFADSLNLKNQASAFGEINFAGKTVIDGIEISFVKTEIQINKKCSQCPANNCKYRV